MKKILITGGTVFVSRFVATYFVNLDYDVYVLNRNHHPQVKGVHLIQADRNRLGNCLKGYAFDTVLDITAYTKQDVKNLLDGLGDFKNYIFISSSAVYPETLTQPFHEQQKVGENKIWQAYGTNKIEAEDYLLEQVPDAYIIRPPYLYGPMQNVYREPFVFDCAIQHRKFYIPEDGTMKLQFFHVADLCKVIKAIMTTQPANKIYNVGNKEVVDINTFVEMCYQIVGTPLTKVYVTDYSQRDYFSFHKYEYILDVSNQEQLLANTIPLYSGLQESYSWYKEHPSEVNKKPYLSFIDTTLVDI